MFSPGQIAISADLGSGVLLIDAKGFLSEQQLVSAAGQLRDCDRLIRVRHGFVKVKLLAISGIVQSVLAMRRAESIVGDLARPEDRIAIVVSSTLLRMQLGRLFKTTGMKAFTREGEADAWLHST